MATIMTPGFLDEGNMKRAIFVALGTGAAITSAAAISIGASTLEAGPHPAPRGEYQVAMLHQSARESQRARIEARYQTDRARCDSVSGFKRDKCLIKAHAAKGRAMLEAAAPYEAVRHQP
jgi:hypothetical protein